MNIEQMFRLSREIENEVIRLEKKERDAGDRERLEIVEKLRGLAYENCELVQDL